MARRLDVTRAKAAEQYERSTRDSAEAWSTVIELARSMFDNFMPSVYASLFENVEVLLKLLQTDPFEGLDRLSEHVDVLAPEVFLSNVIAASQEPPQFVEGSSRDGLLTQDRYTPSPTNEDVVMGAEEVAGNGSSEEEVDQLAIDGASE
jgi:hypothetical protein